MLLDFHYEASFVCLKSKHMQMNTLGKFKEPFKSISFPYLKEYIWSLKRSEKLFVCLIFIS